ncbi:MAG: hypothetical protein VW867_09395, partial [Gammaproteobacteria bacterium]
PLTKAVVPGRVNLSRVAKCLGCGGIGGDILSPEAGAVLMPANHSPSETKPSARQRAADCQQRVKNTG